MYATALFDQHEPYPGFLDLKDKVQEQKQQSLDSIARLQEQLETQYGLAC
jgi:hypothetical protein